jgi:acyl-CoA thioesterase
MNLLQKFFQNDRFAARSGIELVEVSEGCAKAKMAVTPEHYNGIGTVQGGAIFTLADLAFAAATNSHGTVAVALNVSISFIKAATTGILYAEAKEVALNPKISTCTVRVTDEENELIALFQGLAYRKKDRIEDLPQYKK